MGNACTPSNQNISLKPRGQANCVWCGCGQTQTKRVCYISVTGPARRGRTARTAAIDIYYWAEWWADLAQPGAECGKLRGGAAAWPLYCYTPPPRPLPNIITASRATGHTVATVEPFSRSAIVIVLLSVCVWLANLQRERPCPTSPPARPRETQGRHKKAWLEFATLRRS